jgi:hypothetical protein
MAEGYAYDLAGVYVHTTLAYFQTERRAFDAAIVACDVVVGSHDEAILKLLGLGTKAKVQVLDDDLPAARVTIAQADGPLSEGTIPPWHFGAVARSRLMLAAREAERGVAHDFGSARTLRRVRRDALWAAARLAWFRPDVWLALGQLEWLAGRRRSGMRWLTAALDEAERLKMRPDAARARVAIARRLLEGGGAGARFRSQDAVALLADAARELEALDLAWDLEQLDRVRVDAGLHPAAVPLAS